MLSLIKEIFLVVHRIVKSSIITVKPDIESVSNPV